MWRRMRLTLDPSKGSGRRQYNHEYPCWAPKFVFLNKTVDFDAAIDWNDPTLEKLWIYNLHYFADLNAIDIKQS